MADHALHFLVGQFLRDHGGGARIGLIVFAQHFKLYFLPADRQTLGIGFVKRHACAVLVVFTQ